MTAPVLSPVRWWRDDATRYVTRGSQIVPSAPAVEWAFELLRPSDPDIARRIEEQREAIMGPGLDLAGIASGTAPDPWGDHAMRNGRSVADPVVDIRAFFDAQRLEIDRFSRERR